MLPLQALPYLSKLVLQAGNFINFQALAHLTSLRLRYSTVDSAEDCMCASKLQKLDLYHSRVEIHSGGLSACQGLKSLSSVESQVQSNKHENMLSTSFNPDTFQVPDSISVLTCLTQLATQVPATAIGKLDLRWLYSLKTLRDLNLLYTDVSLGLTYTSFTHTMIQKIAKVQIESS